MGQQHVGNESPFVGHRLDAGSPGHSPLKAVKKPVLARSPAVALVLKQSRLSSIWRCELDGSQAAQPKRSVTFCGAAYEARPVERA